MFSCQIFPPSVIKTKRSKSASFKEAFQQIEDFIANPEYSTQLLTGELDNRPETDVEFNKLRETEQHDDVECAGKGLTTRTVRFQCVGQSPTNSPGGTVFRERTGM
ncbi:putative oxidoreductase GLYR1 homolog [Culex quinquefasciatus]|uniref:putative oxidoreductase GLYR1 homolog n=1 Tax=Culex quinquefasciatus TaxID=7176 RepID=UPI0018E31611|nr:putative oxidoreductase GLYR1 homolog [Culex quinquefasciatus]